MLGTLCKVAHSSRAISTNMQACIPLGGALHKSMQHRPRDVFLLDWESAAPQVKAVGCDRPAARTTVHSSSLGGSAELCPCSKWRDRELSGEHLQSGAWTRPDEVFLMLTDCT